MSLVPMIAPFGWFSNGAIIRTCDIWDADYNSDNWKPEFITIFVIWQLIVTLDSIRNSCDVFFVCWHSREKNPNPNKLNWAIYFLLTIWIRMRGNWRYWPSSDHLLTSRITIPSTTSHCNTMNERFLKVLTKQWPFMVSRALQGFITIYRGSVCHGYVLSFYF